MENEWSVPFEYDELRDMAREQLSQSSYDYVASGAGSGETVQENRSSFQRFRIVPRVLADISDRSLAIELFDHEIAAPVLLAPIGGQMICHEEGELATARAAAELGVPMVLSTAANHTIERVAEANGTGFRLFQLYWPNNWAVAESLVERAEAAGYAGIVLTVDAQIPRWHPRVLRHSYTSMDSSGAVFKSDPVVQRSAEDADTSLEEYVTESSDLIKDASLTWDDLDTLREWTNLPIILKGILAPEDAKRAADWGVDGIVVSNHGGRQIDGEVAPLDQLSTIAEHVDDDTTILFDSGIRSGADAFKALALGADAVQLGRPYVFGLTVAGQRGVYEVVLNHLAELESVLGLSGHRSISRVDQRALTPR